MALVFRKYLLPERVVVKLENKSENYHVTENRLIVALLEESLP